MKRAFALITVLFLLFPISSSAQVKRLSREAIDSIRNMKVHDNGESILAFSKKVIDFGTVYESDTARTFSFPFRNTAREKVVVKEVSVNCGCLYSYCEKYEYEPGEEGELLVTFNPKGRSGTVDKNIFIYTLSCELPVAKLTLLGNVVDKNEWSHLPMSMGNLRLKRKSVVFEPVKPGTSPQMRIPCANVGTSPLCLYSRLLPAYVEFATEPAEIAPGEEADIVITINGDKLPNGGNGKCSVLVEGVAGGISDRTIEIKIENSKE
ncbi:MAG: DUF1573 domain-containing protein [Bacteroidaceae bacterium]|nr:DUF1573 domain-containing protein [Bacteroidaceae bacterium]